MQFGVAGITFRVKENPEVGKLRPKGSVRFEKEDNKYDPNAIAIYWENYHIGYVPKELNKGWNYPTGQIIDYAYFDGSFNTEHKGVLQSITVEVGGEMVIDGEKITFDEENHIYEDSKGVLLSASKLSKMYPSNIDRLIKWAFENYKNFEEYKTGLGGYADDGTDVHDICEKALKGERVSHPVKNFIDKYKPKVLGTEQVVYDKESRIVGKYDALVEIKGKKILIDWKNGPSRKKHWVQLGFYADQTNADEMWIVSFKSKAKQGYSISKETDIKKWAEIGKLFAKAYYLIKS